MQHAFDGRCNPRGRESEADGLCDVVIHVLDVAISASSDFVICVNMSVDQGVRPYGSNPAK